MRLAPLTMPWMLTLLACSLAAGCGDAEKSDDPADSGADGATDGSADGSADGTTDGSADGTTDGSADGSADGAADGSADGAADGGADGGSDGGSAEPELVFSQSFEERALSPGEATDASSFGVGDWSVITSSGSYYDASWGGDVIYWVNGGAFRPGMTEFTSTEPLAAPADGNNVVYLTHYADVNREQRGAIIGDPRITIAAETRYTMVVAIGQRAGFAHGVTNVALFVDDGGTAGAGDSVELSSSVPSGGWIELEVPYDPPDSLAGQPLKVQLAFTSTNPGYSTVAWDNVRIYTTPARPN